MATTLTLTTRKELQCVIGLHVSRPLRDVLEEVRSLAVDTSVDADHVTLVFRDPLDALLGWRHLDRTFSSNAYLMSAVASAAAMEMLRDPSELARESLVALTAGATGTRTEHGLVLVNMTWDLEYRPAVELGEHPAFALVLLVIDGRRDRVVELTQPGWIGRDQRAPVRIEDGWMSRRHAELGVDSHAGWFVRDAGSANGIYIAAVRTGGVRQTLHPGLVLQFGSFAVVVMRS